MFSNFNVLWEIIFSIILGAVQGVTEFLPISSTAHLLLTSKILTGKEISLMASNIIQFGTFIAILQFFWGDIKGLFYHIFLRIKSKKEVLEFFSTIKSWFKNPKQEFTDTQAKDIILSQLFVATLPIIIVSLLFRKMTEGLRDDLRNVALFLTIGGCIIVAAEFVHYSRYKKEEKLATLLSFKEALTVGIFQSLAILPGISRSGATLAGGLFLGRDRKSSVRFSFLLSLPTLALASIYDFSKVISDVVSKKASILPGSEGWQTNQLNLSLLSIVVGTIVSYFIGLWCLKWLLAFLGKHDSRVFIIYRIALVIVILVGYYQFGIK
jgi:undecaprenyl-diphosphatase